MKCWLVLILTMAVASKIWAGAEVRNGVAAIVNDAVITYQEVEQYTEPQMQLLLRTYGNKPEVFRKKRIELLQEGVEQLLERQLILDDFKSSGGSLPESYIEDEIKDRIRRTYKDRANLAQSLKAEGVSQETFRKRARDEIIISFMRQRNIGHALLISPEKIERYYQTNLNAFQVGDEVKLRILVLKRPRTESAGSVRQLAQEILLKIDEGATFADMAAIYSEGSQQKDGGDWGWVARSKMNPGLAEIAFSLKPLQRSSVIGLARDPVDGSWILQYDPKGQISSARKYSSRDTFLEELKSGPGDDLSKRVPEPQEFYVMQLDESRPSHTRDLAEVRDQIEKDLLVQERERLRKKWVERLKAKAFVRYF